MQAHASSRPDKVCKFHIALWFRHFVKHPSAQWTDVPNLPKAAISLLENKFTQMTSSILQCQTSDSADTTKLLVQLASGQQVEAVIMHYDTSGLYSLPCINFSCCWASMMHSCLTSCIHSTGLAIHISFVHFCQMMCITYNVTKQLQWSCSCTETAQTITCIHQAIATDVLHASKYVASQVPDSLYITYTLVQQAICTNLPPLASLSAGA